MGIEIILICDSNLSRLNRDGTTQVWASSFDWTRNAIYTFPKWATNIWPNVRKLEEHLNPKSGKMQFQYQPL
jgi:hypothetical protein